MSRAVAGALALALIAGACSSGGTVERPSGPVSYGVDDDEVPPSAEPSTGGRRKGGGGSSPTASAAPSSPVSSGRAAPPPRGPNVYYDDGPVGSLARDYLADARARRLIVEVDYVAGAAPSRGALDHLQRVLRREADKPDGVSVLLGDAIPGGRSSWTFEQIHDLEASYRDRDSEGDTVIAWIVWLDGQLAGEPNALGVAYKASGAAVFPERIGVATTAAVQRVAIERAVFTHEMGHLLGLIDLAFESPHRREDPSSEGHSSEDDSVMSAAVRDLSLVALISGGPPDDFNAHDRDDLAGLRTGRF